MVLQHIEYFRAVAETGSMTKAAAALHVSQPSLSVAIAKLEEELGAKLFDRTGNRVYLNQLGLRFLQRTDEIMRELTDARNELQELSGRYSRQITVLSDFDHLFLPLIPDYASAHPELQITQLVATPEKIRDMLKNGTADFAVSTRDVSDEQIRWKQLARRRHAVLLSEDSPLLDRPRLTPKDLKDQTFVLYISAMNGADLQPWFLDQFGYAPEIRMITNEFETMVEMVSRNLGVSIVTEHDAEVICSNERKRLCYSVLEGPDMLQKIGIAWREGHFLSDASKDLMDYTEAHFRTGFPSL